MIAGPNSCADPLRSALRHSILSSVNHKSVAAQESDERQTKLARKLHRKTRRCRYRRYHGNPGDDCLLNNFESPASADKQDAIA